METQHCSVPETNILCQNKDNESIDIEGIDKKTLLRNLWELPRCLSLGEKTMWSDKEADDILRVIEVEGQTWINFLCGNALREVMSQNTLSSCNAIYDRQTLESTVAKSRSQ